MMYKRKLFSIVVSLALLLTVSLPSAVAQEAPQDWSNPDTALLNQRDDKIGITQTLQGNPYGCYGQTDRPHKSTHVPGTVNVVARTECATLVPEIYVETVLQIHRMLLYVYCERQDSASNRHRNVDLAVMELRNLLELLYTAHNRWSSIQLTWQYWYRVDVMNEAGEKWAAQHPPGSVSVLQAKSAIQSQNQQEINVRRRVWWQKPSRWRDEQEMEGHGTTIRVICQKRWWSFSSASRKLYTNVVPENLHRSVQTGVSKSKHPGGTHVTQIEDVVHDVPLIDPSFLLASHDLQLLESTVYVGREAVRVRAVFRKGKEPIREPFFWAAADEYELLVDKERGILLRYAANLRGQEYAAASVEQVAFDERIPETVFIFSPPANSIVEIVS